VNPIGFKEAELITAGPKTLSIKTSECKVSYRRRGVSFREISCNFVARLTALPKRTIQEITRNCITEHGIGITNDMEEFAAWLRRNLWAAFLMHQAGLFIIAFGFLTLVRRITGRTVHLGRDPLGLGDGVALVVLSVAVILLTAVFYHWIKGADVPRLGIALSARRLLDLVIGILMGIAFVIAPWAIALFQRTASIYDRIDSHFDSFTIARILTVTFFLLLLSSMMEETANRAFPMRLWEARSLSFRLVVPSIFFVAIHMISEPFSFERIGVLFMASILQGIAYLLTGNIWFCSGLHAGANIASFSVTGLWHAGAIVALVGRPAVPNWLAGFTMLALLSVIFALSQRRKAKLRFHLPAGTP
jgi:membrane protease YdiL (CAAX protease family)